MNTKKAIGAALIMFFSIGVAYAGDTIRWDIILLNPGTCPIPGGTASALANDGSKISVTGSGTFVVSSSRNDSTHAVTGGGAWTTVNASGAATGGGFYTVTDLVRWERPPGSNPCSPDATDGLKSPGLAVLKINYDDGTEGVLTVSCRQAGTPASVFEGIAASKESVAYYRNIEPVPGASPNRTLFHIQKGDGTDKD